MTQLTDKVNAIKVPDKVNDFKSFVESVKNDEVDTDVGKFKFLFATKAATEEDARKVVKCNQDFVRGAKVQMAFYENYEGRHSSFPSAISSLHSLLRSKGLDDKNNFALIEKETTTNE